MGYQNVVPQKRLIWPKTAIIILKGMIANENKRQLMEQIKSDIARLGGNYPVLAVYKTTV